jgi:drug/metabolite transporter (DMT)-like permease
VNALLALLASVLWGTSDYGGGIMSRRVPAAAAVLISQAFAFVLLLGLLPVRQPPGGGYLLLAAGAGVIATGSLAAFYRAMASAPLSLVAPITAAGTGIPVLAGLIRGERLHPVQAAGVVVTLAGIVLASGPEWRSGAGVRRQAVGYAIAASMGFGAAYTMLAVAAHGDLYGTLLAQRAGGLVALGPVVAATGIMRGMVLSVRRLAALAAIGVSDIVANGSYAYAASRGNLAIAAVLASLYPVVTALLARGLLAERLRPVQTAGVVTALCGVVMLAA